MHSQVKNRKPSLRLSLSLRLLRKIAFYFSNKSCLFFPEAVG